MRVKFEMNREIEIQKTAENLSCADMNRFAIYTGRRKLRGTLKLAARRYGDDA